MDSIPGDFEPLGKQEEYIPKEKEMNEDDYDEMYGNKTADQDRYGGGKESGDNASESVNQPEEANKIEIDKSYHEATSVKGIDISVGWNDEAGDYSVNFPNMPLGEEATKKGIYVPFVKVPLGPAEAKDVFGFAVGLANEGFNIYEIHKQIEKYSKKLLIIEETKKGTFLM